MTQTYSPVTHLFLPLLVTACSPGAARETPEVAAATAGTSGCDARATLDDPSATVAAECLLPLGSTSLLASAGGPWNSFGVGSPAGAYDRRLDGATSAPVAVVVNVFDDHDAPDGATCAPGAALGGCSLADAIARCNDLWWANARGGCRITFDDLLADVGAPADAIGNSGGDDNHVLDLQDAADGALRELRIDAPYVTIDGSTAGGPLIIAGATLGIWSHDVHLRELQVLPGAPTGPSHAGGAINVVRYMSFGGSTLKLRLPGAPGDPRCTLGNFYDGLAHGGRGGVWADVTPSASGQPWQRDLHRWSFPPSVPAQAQVCVPQAVRDVVLDHVALGWADDTVLNISSDVPYALVIEGGTLITDASGAPVELAGFTTRGRYSSGVHDVTVARSMIGQPIDFGRHFKGRHGAAVLVDDGVRRIAFLANLIHDSRFRNPAVFPGSTSHWWANRIINVTTSPEIATDLDDSEIDGDATLSASELDWDDNTLTLDSPTPTPIAPTSSPALVEPPCAGGSGCGFDWATVGPTARTGRLHALVALHQGQLHGNNADGVSPHVSSSELATECGLRLEHGESIVDRSQGSKVCLTCGQATTSSCTLASLEVVPWSPTACLVRFDPDGGTLNCGFSTRYAVRDASGALVSLEQRWQEVPSRTTAVVGAASQEFLVPGSGADSGLAVYEPLAAQLAGDLASRTCGVLYARRTSASDEWACFFHGEHLVDVDAADLAEAPQDTPDKRVLTACLDVAYAAHVWPAGSATVHRWTAGACHETNLGAYDTVVSGPTALSGASARSDGKSCDALSRMVVIGALAEGSTSSPDAVAAHLCSTSSSTLTAGLWPSWAPTDGAAMTCFDALYTRTGAPAEVCDGEDNDCDGLVDESGPNSYYLDADGDGFGAEGTVVQACAAPAGYTATGGDCDDTRASVHPATGAETALDGVDDDCDGRADDGTVALSAVAPVFESTQSCGDLLVAKVSSATAQVITLRWTNTAQASIRVRVGAASYGGGSAAVPFAANVTSRTVQVCAVADANTAPGRVEVAATLGASTNTLATRTVVVRE